MAYFVRVDPAYADRVFHSHAWDMHAAPPSCTVLYFERTPHIAMGPVLERYMTAYLMHGDVAVKEAATQSLGRFGSAAAVGPLVHLRNAIARGQHWFAGEAELKTIRSLCISEQCQFETEQDLSNRQSPLRIEVAVGADANGSRGTVAQYDLIGSIEALEEKLDQFPKGTQFKLNSWGGGDDWVNQRIRRHAAEHGLTIVFAVTRPASRRGRRMLHSL